MGSTNHFLVGVYSDPEEVLHAAKKVKESGVKIHEVYSPFPIHGIDEVLAYKRTRLPIVAFMFGITGTFLALGMQIWMMGIDWPMIIGGKDFIALPSFIPITFEITVLLSALGMVGTFFVISDLKPYKKLDLFDPRITQDKCVMVIDLTDNKKSKEEIHTLIQSSGAEEVNEKIFE
jgi:hypothetical protein